MKFNLVKLKWILFVFIIILSLTFLLSISLINPLKKNSLSVTLEHPFYLNSKWVKASELIVGDELTTSTGRKAKITGIRDVFSNDPVAVYNLKVNNFENYFAGNVLVHNKAMRIPEETFYNVREIKAGEIGSLYQEKQALDSLASQNSPGIISNEFGDFKDVYIIDPKTVNKEHLPENLRYLVEDSDDLVVIKFSRESRRSELSSPAESFTNSEKSVEDFTNEVIVADKVNSELRKQGLEDLFPEKKYFGANFDSSDGKVIGQAIIVEDHVPGDTVYDLMQTLENDYYHPYSIVPTELGDRAIDIGNKVNDKIMDIESEVRKIFVKEKFYWYDVHDKNFAISFTDNSGKQLSLKEIIDSDIDIDKEVRVHFKAYEVGGVDPNGDRGYLVEFDDLLINVPPVY
ncbi:MAG: polymorphic toxin-type HINT domain-containing protein [Candidatus Pacearchaeota archaeon]|jgi:hypothetical protein